MRQRRSHRPTPVTKQFESAISEIGSRGDGIATYEGKQVFVPCTAPGDVARISASGGKGRVLELLEESPVRATPPCALYGTCGGCGLQHVMPDFYDDWQRQQILSALRAAGLFDVDLVPTVKTATAARRRAKFYVVRKGTSTKLGYFERRSHQVVDLSDCLVLHPKLTTRLEGLRQLARSCPKTWTSFSMAVTLCDNGLDVNFDNDKRLSEPSLKELSVMTDAMKTSNVLRISIAKDPMLSLTVPTVDMDGIKVALPPDGFLQASAEGQEKLILLVSDALRGTRKIVDLFCGAGTFTLPLARHATLWGIDSDGPAIDALNNAVRQSQGSGLNPVKTEIRNLFERPLSALELNQFRGVVIDPPRSGAQMQMSELVKSKIVLVVSVSCNAKTFARDAKILIDGGFSLEKLTPVDQFIYSPHIELVGVFKRKR